MIEQQRVKYPYMDWRVMDVLDLHPFVVTTIIGEKIIEKRKAPFPFTKKTKQENRFMTTVKQFHEVKSKNKHRRCWMKLKERVYLVGRVRVHVCTNRGIAIHHHY